MIILNLKRTDDEIAQERLAFDHRRELEAYERAQGEEAGRH